MRFSLAGIAVAALLTTQSVLVSALDLNPDDPKSVFAVAKVLSDNIMEMYTGNKSGGDFPGRFPAPYYWWESGAVMGALIDYWAYTGDAGNNPAVTQALIHQAGDDRNYEPTNVTRELGNDDQSFWALSAMTAAERKYPDPPTDQPQWLALAQAVFVRQTPRWEPEFCNGGMRWQVVQFNAGYNYKNTVSNGLYFQIGARLARFTGNETYAKYAERAYDWLVEVGFVNSEYKVFDGGHIEKGCLDTSYNQWSYNAGIILAGCATMYNYSTPGAEQEKWRQRTEGLMKALDVFFIWGAKDVMYEVACERDNKCNRDQRSFRAYLARFMALTVQMAPFTQDYIMPKLRTTAIAAAKQCDGGDNGRTCGMRWTVPTCDGSFEVGILGQTLSALEVVQSTLILSAPAPVTAKSGGTSKGDLNAGMTGLNYTGLRDLSKDPITTGEKVGAAFLTLLVGGVLGGFAWFMVTDRV
ncbi:glycosyl hydrolase family 76-domain-containing protein [Tirmania nivea]|nr:glycosyl hydrolase family 76-domain-containing protein [Tirmania nivea]